MNTATGDCRNCGAILTEHIPKVTCGNSCHECGKYAYSSDKPSYLYLLTNSHLQLHKIGIGTVGKDKNYLQQLIQAGWTPYGLWHSAKKEETFRWEKEVFKKLSERFELGGLDVPGFVGRSDRHWFESVNAQAISISDLAHLASTVVSGKVK